MHVTGNQITAAVIVVSLDATTQKKVVCMLVNFARVMGLSQSGDAPFSKTWPQNKFPERNLTNDELLAIPDFRLSLNAMSVLSYIHACDALGPGMSKDAAIAELKQDSVCLRDLMRD